MKETANANIVKNVIENQNPKLLSASELHSSLQDLTQQERKITKIILMHIQEVDQRKLYLKMAYPSLFEYLVRGHGYSEASAQRRIDAARMMIQVPELGHKIESGEISLNQISKVQQAIRQSKKAKGKMIDANTKKQIISKIQNKSGKQTELILAQEFQLPIQQTEYAKIQADKSTRLEIIFDQNQMQILTEAKIKFQHVMKNGSWAELMTLLATKTLAEKQATRGADNKADAKVVDEKKPTSAVKVAIVNKVRTAIMARDQVCQFTDHSTGKICGAKYFLEIDHIQPKWAGGGNEQTNLRVLCSAHNKFRYQAGL